MELKIETTIANLSKVLEAFIDLKNTYKRRNSLMVDSVNTSNGRTPEFLALTQKISDYMRELPLNSEQHNTLVEMLTKQLTMAEQNAFKYAMRISGLVLQLYGLMRCFDPPSESEYEKILHDAVSLMESAKSVKE